MQVRPVLYMSISANDLRNNYVPFGDATEAFEAHVCWTIVKINVRVHTRREPIQWLRRSFLTLRYDDDHLSLVLRVAENFKSLGNVM